MGIFSRFVSGGNREDKAVKRAMSNPSVLSFMQERKLTVEDIRALRSRLRALVPEEKLSDRALLNVDLLDWFFSLPDPNVLTLDQSLQLTKWVRYG